LAAICDSSHTECFIFIISNCSLILGGETLMQHKKALILFAHGARAASWKQPFERLQALSQAKLTDATVKLAFLELMEPSLPDVVAELVQSGCEQIQVVPVFLGQGAHVLRDLPLIIEELTALYPQVGLQVSQAVGENTIVLDAIAAYCVSAVE
jgi:sirohydrochlorin cobaltochelatase